MTTTPRMLSAEEIAEIEARSIDRSKDSEFVAYARSDVSRLLSHIAAQAETITRLREVVTDYRDAYPHNPPHDCFATGPLTGDKILDLVICPGCEAERRYAALKPGDMG